MQLPYSIPWVPDSLQKKFSFGESLVPRVSIQLHNLEILFLTCCSSDLDLGLDLRCETHSRIPKYLDEEEDFVLACLRTCERNWWMTILCSINKTTLWLALPSLLIKSEAWSRSSSTPAKLSAPNKRFSSKHFLRHKGDIKGFRLTSNVYFIQGHAMIYTRFD